MDKDVLKEAGLQEGESIVYVALLKLKDSTATQITQETGLHRSYVYDIIEKLREKGLASFVIKNNTKYFRASHPSRILEYLKEKEEKIKEILPKLIELSKEEVEDMKVEIFKGKEGIKTILNDILNNGEDYFLFGHLKFEELFPIYVHQFVKIANKKKITERAILEQGVKIIPTLKHEYKYISKEYMFPNATIIYGKKVVIFTWQKPHYAILMENKDLVNSYKTHFKLLWKIAKN